MHPILRLFGIGTVFSIASIGWLILGGTTSSRSTSQRSSLSDQVSDLWGRPQAQAAPTLTFNWQTTHDEQHSEVLNGVYKLVTTKVTDPHSLDVAPASSELGAKIHLDRRLKGLMWYALYDVGFDGKWTYVHEEKTAGDLAIQFRFPDPQGIYDDFRFEVDGVARPEARHPKDGLVALSIPVTPGQEVSLRIAYKSRGQDQWSYQPASGVASLRNFHLAVATDFSEIDFPAYTMSPSQKAKNGSGWNLDWSFREVVTGHGLGVVMPNLIQPGELAASLAYSAPISLFFFFLVIFVLATLRGLDLHPVNYLFLAGAFFAFHLLFAYSVDHLAVVPAFAVSSAVSMILVVSYLRLVVSARFAFLESALAQLVYLVGFSLAHFFDGFTGLTVTVLSIATLFVLMQLTGRVRWSEVFSAGAGRAQSGPNPAPVAAG
ncbi:MAG: inner membrane CreD family protein [Myxococcota bacterium]